MKYIYPTEQRQGLERLVADDLPGVILNGFKFVQTPSFSKPLEVHYQVTAPQYAHFASYKSSITAKGNVLHYECDYIVRKVQIPASEAPAFRKLESAILMDEKGTAVLKKQ